MKIAEQKEFLLDILKTQNLEELEAFLQSGKNIDLKLNNAKQTLLPMAVYENKIELVKFLLKNGADINSVSYSGSTPIFNVKSLEVATLLVNNGADLKVKDKKGFSILIYLISSIEKEITAYLNKEMGDLWSEDDLRNVEAMDENKYWAIVEKAYRFGKGDERRQAANLVRTLRYWDPPEIVRFQKRTFQLSSFAHTSNLWAAVYVIEEGCSENSFINFKHWLISLGETAFYNCIDKPDNLIRFLKKKANYIDRGNISCNSIESVASMAYEHRTGLDNFDEVVNYSNMPTMSSDFELDWNQNNIEHKKEIFPKIWAKYGLG